MGTRLSAGSGMKIYANGKLIGTTQTIRANNIEVEQDTTPNPLTSLCVKGTFEAAGTLRSAIIAPTFDIRARSYSKKARRFMRSKSRRIRNKWKKRFISEHMWRNCVIAGVEDERSGTL